MSKKIRNFCGVDIGYSGGVSLVAEGKSLPMFWSMPTVKTTVTRRGRKGNATALDLSALWSLFKELKAKYDPFVVVELVHSMPSDGKASAFTFGKQAGAVEALLVAAGLEYMAVPPHVWKKAIIPATAKKSISKDEKKALAISECQSIYEGVNLVPPRCRVPSDGWAEAALLAEYGRRQITG